MADFTWLNKQMLQERYEHCKTNSLCFVSLRPITSNPCRAYDEQHQPDIHFTMGSLLVLEEYVKY